MEPAAATAVVDVELPCWSSAVLVPKCRVFIPSFIWLNCLMVEMMIDFHEKL